MRNHLQVARLIFCMLGSVPRSSTIALGQETTGTCDRDRVKDQNGGIVVGAQMTMADSTHGFQRTYQTSDDGIFNATQLPASSYTLRLKGRGLRNMYKTTSLSTLTTGRIWRLSWSPDK